MKEIWKDIDGFEGLYQVSIWGNVRGRNGILAPYVTEKGYLKVGLFKDGNPKNNSVTNLEWCTNQENTDHAMMLRSGKYIVYED